MASTCRNSGRVLSRRNVAALVMASVSVAGLCAPVAALAQDQAVADDGDRVSVDDIIVTARREAENAQDIPVSVQVLTGDSLEKLAITDFRDIGKIAPGLSISGNGTASAMVLRGVRWNTQSGTPAIPVYLNEAPFNPGNLFTTLYDTGQIEVLRGPQGTARGAPSVPGAITITTRKPDLNEIGGFGDVQHTSFDHTTIQGAVGLPIIQDKLAIRFAGSYDDGKGNRIRSLNSSLDPSLRIISGRVSLRAEPTNNLSFDFMAQHLDTKRREFTGVVGSGSPGALFDPDTAAGPAPAGPNPFAPANYNGPAISASDRLAVQAVPGRSHSKVDEFTFNAKWELLGHTLSSITGYERTVAAPDRGGSDVSNQVQGFYAESVNTAIGAATSFTQELRLSSIRADHFIDYDIGAFYSRSKSKFSYVSYSYLPGALGSFFAPPNPVVTDAAKVQHYLLPSHINVDLRSKNYSFYGNVELHLPSDIEFTGGLRWIHDQRPFNTEGPIGPGTLSLPTSALQVPSCAALASLGVVSSPYYPGQCDVPYTFLGQPTSIKSEYNETFTPVIYNVSLSRKFGQDVLLYATVGSAYRIGIPNTGTFVTDPNLEKSKEESATSYEFGIKTTWINGRLNLNATVYQLDYKDQITQFRGIPYFNVATNQAATTSNFFSNLDAQVRGFEVNAIFRPSERLILSGNLSYSKIKSQGGLVPCDIGTPGSAGDGLSVANQMNFCASKKGQSLNATSPFQASMNGNYTVPLGSVDGYLRFIANYNGKSSNFGNGGLKVKSYAIIDLFAGLTGSEAGWDIGIFVRNVFNKNLRLSENVISPVDSSLGFPGYDSYTQTTPREVGISLRYTFGSH